MTARNPCVKLNVADEHGRLGKRTWCGDYSSMRAFWQSTDHLLIAAKNGPASQGCCRKCLAAIRESMKQV